MLTCSAALEVSHDAVIARFCAQARDAVLVEIRRLTHGATSMAELYSLMLDYPLRHAKGLRPALCIATSRALGATLEAVVPSAAAFELLHNAFLIHDDVEDESLYRRGEPTLQRQVGVPVAVNVADGMFALALTPLLENTEVIGLGPALEVLERIRRAILITVEGQAIELMWVRDNRWRFEDGDYRSAYEDMVVRKTAHYSFIGPVEVGAIIADAPEEVCEKLARYGKHLGIAFQITDDLLNLREDLDAYGKEALGDLWEGKRTLMLLHALHVADEHDTARAIEALSRPRSTVEAPAAQWRATLETLYSQGHIDRTALDVLSRGDASVPAAKTSADVRALNELIEYHGGVAFAKDVAHDHITHAAAALDACAPQLAPGDATDFLRALLKFVVERLR